MVVHASRNRQGDQEGRQVEGCHDLINRPKIKNISDLNSPFSGCPSPKAATEPMARSTIELPRAIASSLLSRSQSQEVKHANSSVIRPCTYAVRSFSDHAGWRSPSSGFRRYSRESRPAAAAIL